MNKLLKKNKHGFYEIANKPIQSELETYYAEKYYQKPSVQYHKNYSEDELEFFSNRGLICLHTVKKILPNISSFFEIGCGEGFFANTIYKTGVKDIVLNDFSDAGLTQFNPHLKKYHKKTDIFKHINELVKENKKFDLISMDNVLEHVINPESLLENVKLIMHKKSILRITVPNDFSEFQNMLLEEEITTDTWVSPPDHLSYFNSENLANFCKNLNFNVHSSQCDFPIELFLTNEYSHYYKNRDHGKGAHRSRIICTNYFVRKDIESFVFMSEYTAKLQYGRNVTIYIGL